jgi:hypothetical protein
VAYRSASKRTGGERVYRVLISGANSTGGFMAEAKTKPTRQSVAAFLAGITDDTRRRDAKAVAALMEAITKTKPTMWGSSIVGFGSHRYAYASGREADWPIAAFSPRKQNLVVYLTPGFAGDTELLDKLGKHKTGKSCLYINSLDDVHVPTLKTLITNSLAYARAKE